jgi:hypothetical protein
MVRLLIAATAVPPAKRGRWLEEIATRLEQAARAREPSASARRQRRYRERQRNDEIILRLSINRDDITAALTGIGALDHARASDYKAIEDALIQQVRDWARAWGERA